MTLRSRKPLNTHRKTNDFAITITQHFRVQTNFQLTKKVRRQADVTYQFSNNRYEQRGRCDITREARNTQTQADHQQSNDRLRHCPE